MTTPPAQISWKLSLVMSLLLLVPGVSFAANEDAPLLAATEPEPPSLLSTEDLLSAQEKAEATRSVHPVLRVAAELGASTLTSVVATMGGFWLIAETCYVLPTDWDCIDPVASGVLGGAILGAPVGAWAAGKLVGGQGTFLGTLLGSGAGFLVGTGAALLMDNPYLGLLTVPLGAVIGSVVGYEVSHSMVSAQRIELASASVQPVLAFSNRGAVLGLNGSF